VYQITHYHVASTDEDTGTRDTQELTKIQVTSLLHLNVSEWCMFPVEFEPGKWIGYLNDHTYVIIERMYPTLSTVPSTATTS